MKCFQDTQENKQNKQNSKEAVVLRQAIT